METYLKNQAKLAQCYFCGEEMPASQLEMHVKHCGCVLEPCPDKCGLYVQRQYKNHHANWCKKDGGKQPQQLVKSELESLKDKLDQEIKERKLQTEEYMKQLQVYQQKMEKTEDLNMKLIDAVTGIRNLVSEEQCARLKDILEVKTNVSEVAKVVTQLKFTLNQARVDVEELRNEVLTNEQYEKMYDQFQEWKKKQDEIVCGIKSTISRDVQTEINRLHKDNIIRSKSVNDLLDLNEVIIDNQDTYTEQIYHLEMEVNGFKKFLAEENVMISGLWRDQLEEIKRIGEKFEENDKAIKDLFEEQKQIKEKVEQFESFTKDLNNINFGNEKVKILERTVSQDLIQELIDDRKVFRERLESLEMLNRPGERTFSTDTSMSEFDSTIAKQQNEIAQRLETLEKLTTEIQNNCSKRNSSSTNNEQNDLPIVINELSSEQAVIKRRLEMLEVVTNELEEVKSRLSQNRRIRNDSPVSINGRLMWTISNFNAKLEESKESKSQIESPCFYTSDCGYKLQLRAYLNGVGQWEGRHMIVSLHVLSSQWDNRLAWPCRMKVILCLRDQEQINRKAKDIMKSFTSSPAQKGFENPCLQMFIPHRTLYTRSYLKNDVVIIDVKALPI
ncbi:reticulocyte-binding protein 2-like isoform X2 [Macrosteles quadrilineatus]|nr:reticulocyte-binding protein 2-like isoform X2 [Macrosteles quadrilineatus]